MTDFNTSKIKGNATTADNSNGNILFENHDFQRSAADNEGIETLKDAKIGNSADLATKPYDADIEDHVIFLSAVIDELSDGFDIPDAIKQELIAAAETQAGTTPTLSEMITAIANILEASDTDSADEIDRDITLQKDVSNTKSADSKKFSEQDFKYQSTYASDERIYLRQQLDVGSLNEKIYDSTAHADFMTQSDGAIDKMAKGFTFSIETKKLLLDEAIEVAKDTKSNPTVSDIVTALATVLERYDSNKADTRDGDTKKDSALSRDTLIKNGLQNIKFESSNFEYGTDASGKKHDAFDEIDTNGDFPTTTSDKYSSENPDNEEALFAGIDILVPALKDVPSDAAKTAKNTELKKALIAEAYSMRDPSDMNFNIGEMMDNIAKILERHDSSTDNNKGDVVHNDDAVLWSQGSTIETKAGVKTLDELFKLFNPNQGKIKTGDAATYFSNLVEDLNAASDGDTLDTTKRISQKELNTIINDSARTGDQMSVDDFKRIVEVIEARSGQKISGDTTAEENSSVNVLGRAATSASGQTTAGISMTEGGFGKIAGTLGDGDKIDTKLGRTSVKDILNYLDADDDGNIIKIKAVNFITTAFNAANNGKDATAEQKEQITELVKKITRDDTPLEVVNAAELEKIMAFAEAILGKDLFDSVDATKHITKRDDDGIITYTSKKYGTYTYDSTFKDGSFTDVTATENKDGEFLNETVAEMLSGVSEDDRKNLSFDDTSWKNDTRLVQSQNKATILDTLRERIKDKLTSVDVNDDEAEIIIQAALKNLQNARVDSKLNFADITVSDLYTEVENIMHGDSEEYEKAIPTTGETPNILRDFGVSGMTSQEALFKKLIEASDSPNGELDSDVVEQFLIGYTKGVAMNEETAALTIKNLVDAKDTDGKGEGRINKEEFDDILMQLNDDIVAGSDKNGFTKTPSGLGLRSGRILRQPSSR